MDKVTEYLPWTASLPLDFVLIGVVFAVLAIDSMRAGSARTASLALGFLTAWPLYTLIPTTSLIAGPSAGLTPLISGLLFVALAFAAAFFIRRAAFIADPGAGQLLQELLAAITAGIIILAVWTSAGALSGLWQFGPLVSFVFAPAYHFWIILAALATLAFARS